MKKEKLPASTSKNHELAPICSEFVRQMRKVFGEDQIKVLYVKENGLEIGANDLVGDKK